MVAFGAEKGLQDELGGCRAAVGVHVNYFNYFNCSLLSMNEMIRIRD